MSNLTSYYMVDIISISNYVQHFYSKMVYSTKLKSYEITKKANLFVRDKKPYECGG